MTLRAVAADEKPDTLTKKKPVTIKQAAESSERELLVTMRAHLANELDKGAVPPHALAGVMAKLREYDRDIRAIDARTAEESDGGEEPTEDAVFDPSAV